MDKCNFCHSNKAISTIEGAIIPKQKEEKAIYGYRYSVCESCAEKLRPFVYLPQTLTLENMFK